MPDTIACAIFADDLVSVALGPKWKDTAPIFRLLAPTILVFAIANPLGWLLSALGLVGRALKIALVFAPFMIAGYVAGLPYGPKGVALAYSSVMTLWAIPFVVWAVQGTMISVRDILTALSLPAGSSIIGAGVALGVRSLYGPMLSPLPRLILEVTVLLIIYAVVLLVGAGKKSVFREILGGFKRPSSAEENSMASA